MSPLIGSRRPCWRLSTLSTPPQSERGVQWSAAAEVASTDSNDHSEPFNLRKSYDSIRCETFGGAADLAARRGTAMTKSELVRRMAELHPHLQHSEVERVVETIFQVMGEALARGGRIEIRGFGSFTIRHREACTGRNPNWRHGRRPAQGQSLLPNRQTSACETERRALGSLIDSRSSLWLIHFLMQKPTPTPKRTSTM